jgi:hypothetical protein
VTPDLGCRLVGDNMRMRKVLIGLIATAVAVTVMVVGAILVDFGASIYAEYRLSTNVRKAANLGSDPFVAILAFPFIPQAMKHHYNDLEIKANAVDHAMVGKATLEATMYSIDLTDSSWLIRPDAKLPVGKLESRIIIDSMHLGRYLGISDLMVEAPPQETNNATGGTTESGISGNRGLVFSGTPKSANFDRRVSVSVDLSIAPDDLGVHRDEHRDRTRHRRSTRSGRQTGRGAARLQRQAAQPEASLRGGADLRGGPRLGRDHRRHHPGSNNHPRGV